MNKPVKLSVVIITGNEERNIRRCLESVKGIADDVTVIDSLSNDETVKICRELGATVYSQEFLGHVEQKNFAITKAKYPHILSLDADEALDKTLQKEVQKIKENWSHDGYSMNRLTNYCGKWIYHCGWYPDKKLRMWDSAKGKWEGINPHDEFRLQKGATVSHLSGNILHFSYHSISDHIRQVNYFTDISAKANLMKGRRGSLLRILLSPLVKFFRDYVFKLGFLDGYYGLVICMISSHATFLKYIKMRQFRENDFTDAYPT